jgi:hypothetical protein
MLIAQAVPQAPEKVSLAFDAVRVLDGGDAEDMMRSLSNLATENPRLLLEMLRTKSWQEGRIRTLLRMLPLETVDRPAAKIHLVRERIRAIHEIREKRLDKVRDLALNILMQYEAELEH